METMTIPNVVTIPAENQQLLDKIFSWDLSRVKTYMVSKDIYMADKIDLLEREYKRFIFLCSLNINKSVPISIAVDKMWHTHILFTRDYADFCNSIRGKFIHHNPTVDESERDELKNVYEVNTLRLYKKYFGDYDETFWIVNGQVCKECCNNCDDE